ncbi:MAG: HDIG domain-containing protein [Deltaproteobacteria bacterium]|nr:HDIG domain-containing protein [Deltaproteobacteria bacterium]
MGLTIQDIKDYAEQCLSKANRSHAWEHTQRVRNLCMHIGRVEEADKEVLELAAHLHDIGRLYQDESKGTICHAEKGAEMAGVLCWNSTQFLPSKKTMSSTVFDLTGFGGTATHRPLRPKFCLMPTNLMPLEPLELAGPSSLLAR